MRKPTTWSASLTTALLARTIAILIAGTIVILIAGTIAIPIAGTIGMGLRSAEAKESVAQPGDTIAWTRNVPEAFKQAKAQRKILMICINSKTVDGTSREEPAAKGLREVVYKDPKIVGKSRHFICVFLTPAAGGEDYGELRHRFGIDGQIVSPQHIFAHPDHKTGKPMVRMEYWSYGKDAPAVKKLLAMMSQAQTRFSLEPTLPDAPETAPDAEGGDDAPVEHGAPAAAEARAKWIQEMLDFVSGGDDARRKQALVSLVTNDKESDCLTPLSVLLPTLDQAAQQVDVMRALGRDKLFVASAPIEEFLNSKDELLRGIAAVSLEYIGNPESIKPLSKRLGKERIESIQNNLARALGRCGKGDKKVRAKLAKLTSGGKTELSGIGAIIGMAYFEKDAKAARALEKQLKKLGPPSFGRRGGGSGMLRRAMLAWAVAEIGDPKSGEAITKSMLEPMRNMKNRWMRRITDFYGAVVEVCNGKQESMGDVVSGLQRTLQWAGGEELKDEARKERETANFTPKADWDISPRDAGGGGGGR